MKRSVFVRLALALAVPVAVALPAASYAQTPATSASTSARYPGCVDPRLAVGTQYDSTHVYVTPGSVAAFTTSWEATFGGTNTAPAVTDVTPTPSQTISELIHSPVGELSVFDFQTPAPYPFGAERTGWLMSDFPAGVAAAQASGADVVVSPFDDPIGKDAVIQFPGGVDAQLYWHTTAPSYPALGTVPVNRIYLSPDSADAFLHSYLSFTCGTVTSDDARADGGQIGLPGTDFRRIDIGSPFGKTEVVVTDGHLPYPFGREVTGYAVTSVTATLAAAKGAGATVLWGPYTSRRLDSAILQFPGGYIAEIHDGGSR
jgi:hypothetical protein